MLATRGLWALLVLTFFSIPSFARDEASVPVRVVVSVEGHKDSTPPTLNREDVMVFLDNQRMQVTGWTPIQDVGLDVWLLIDDGSDSELGTQLDDLRKFVLEQSSTTQIGIGYLRNGSVDVLQKPTSDHAVAAKALRLPLGVPGISASPYLALVDLLKKWPATDRTREVVMVTSGIDPDYGGGPSNPYLEQAIHAAQRAGVVVHSIYFGSAGHFGHSLWQINWGQNYLSQLAEETGGEFFWLGSSNPVAFSPYLKTLTQRFGSQSVLTFLAPANVSDKRLRLKTEIPHAMLVGPSKVFVSGGK
jgi:hypothetical protein